jgi:hypothetical protein
LKVGEIVTGGAKIVTVKIENNNQFEKETKVAAARLLAHEDASSDTTDSDSIWPMIRRPRHIKSEQAIALVKDHKSKYSLHEDFHIF